MFVVIGSVVAPKLLLNRTIHTELGLVMDAPEEYYVDAGATMARELSKNLSALDRIKLISGVWASEMEVCDKKEGFLDENEAVTLAKNQLDLYYKQGVYPYSLNSEFDNWYSYSTKLYRFTDSNFHMYTAYMWAITFTKYDESIVQQIYITESGTILLARTNSTHHMSQSILTCYELNPIKELIGGESVYLKDVKNRWVTTIEIPYPDVEQDNLEVDSGARILIPVSGETEVYEAFQFNSDSGFGIVFMPIQF